MKHIKTTLTIICLLLLFAFSHTFAYAHSGNTDSFGGHIDHSTGEYHYHHGHSAHQHESDGSCPYDNESKSSPIGEIVLKFFAISICCFPFILWFGEFLSNKITSFFDDVFYVLLSEKTQNKIRIMCTILIILVIVGLTLLFALI